MMKIRSFLQVSAAVLVVGACALFGQSGSQGPGAETVPCPCEVGGVFLKAEVLTMRGNCITLKIQEVIHGDSAFDEGEVIEATWDGSLPCYTGQTQVEVGDTALVTYRNSALCDGQGGAAGASQASSECIVAGSSGFEVKLTKWEDEILFAESKKGQILVPADELSNLWGNNACSDDYGDWAELLEHAP